MSIISGNSHRLCSNASSDYTGTGSGSAFQAGVYSPPQSISENALPHVCHLHSYSPGPATHAAPSILAKSPCSVPRLAPGPRSLKVTHRCLKAMAPRTTPRLFQSGLQLGTTSRRKIVTADASSSGWGALYEGNPAYGSWLTHERCLHINCLKMMAVCLALKTFQP